MNQTQFNSANQNPNYIAQQAKDAETAILDFLSERKQYKTGNFKALKSKGDSNDCYAQQKTRDGPTKRPKKTAQNNPNKISDKTHVFNLFF